MSASVIDQGTEVIDGFREPAGYQQITSLNTAQSLTVPAGARLAIIQAETQAVRWRDDGTNPTSTVGMYMAALDTIIYNGDLTKFKAIETTASAKLNITYFK